MVPIDRDAVRRQHRHVDVRESRHPLVILADNVDKASNLGGLIRTADAFRCERVVTNRPEVDTAGAMGADHWQPVAWEADLLQVAREYRKSGYSVVALEQEPNAVPLDRFVFPRRTVLIVGSEMFGVSPEILEIAEATVYIPQAGLTNSLNVSAAMAIAAYEYSRQHWMMEFVQPARHLEVSSASVRVPTKPQHHFRARANG